MSMLNLDLVFEFRTHTYTNLTITRVFFGVHSNLQALPYISQV